MTKQEFMYRLAQELLTLPPEERVCALTFYEEYFADAGEENAEAVIRELGSPEAVARAIKEDFAQRNPGYDPAAPGQTYRPGPQYRPGRGRQTYTTNPGDPPPAPESPEAPGGEAQACRKGMSPGGVVLIVVLLLVGSPLWLTLLLVLLAILAAVVGVVFAAAVALAGLVAGLLAGGAACLWASLTAGLLTPGLRLLGVGGGLLILGLGLLGLALAVWLAVRVLPWLFRGVVELCRKPFHRKKGGAQ